MNLAAEEAACTELLKRKPTKEEFVLYLNHPADALKTMQFRMQYGDPNNLPPACLVRRPQARPGPLFQ